MKMTILALNISKDELQTVKNALDSVRASDGPDKEADNIYNARAIINGLLEKFPKSTLAPHIIKNIESNVNSLKCIGVPHKDATEAVAVGYDRIANDFRKHGMTEDKRDVFVEMAKHVRAMTP